MGIYELKRYACAIAFLLFFAAFGWKVFSDEVRNISDSKLSYSVLNSNSNVPGGTMLEKQGEPYMSNDLSSLAPIETFGSGKGIMLVLPDIPAGHHNIKVRWLTREVISGSFALKDERQYIVESSVAGGKKILEFKYDPAGLLNRLFDGNIEVEEWRVEIFPDYCKKPFVVQFSIRQESEFLAL